MGSHITSKRWVSLILIKLIWSLRGVLRNSIPFLTQIPKQFVIDTGISKWRPQISALLGQNYWRTQVRCANNGPLTLGPRMKQICTPTPMSQADLESCRPHLARQGLCCSAYYTATGRQDHMCSTRKPSQGQGDRGKAYPLLPVKLTDQAFYTSSPQWEWVMGGSQKEDRVTFADVLSLRNTLRSHGEGKFLPLFQQFPTNRNRAIRW